MFRSESNRVRAIPLPEQSANSRHRASLVALLCGGALAFGATYPGAAAEYAPSPGPAAAGGEVRSASADRSVQPAPRPASAASGLIYDTDYPFIDYSGTPEHNDIAHLAIRVARGEVKLIFSEPRGYLDSLLAALHIDKSSQVLVFSKTSLQTDAISPQTPRALYFNDDTYVGWISGSNLLEITTMDSMMGTVFYTVLDEASVPAHFERETSRCLACHDTFSLSGGGVPNFLFLSAYSRRQNEIVTNDVANRTTDETPLTERWGGWYVTGDLRGLAHLGNILPSPAGAVPLSSIHSGNPATLNGLFDTKPYLTEKSDVVALLVIQHQVDIHNLIIHANYKCRMLMEKTSPGSSTKDLQWEQLPPLVREHFKDLLEPLVRGMLFVDAAKLTTPIRGDSGFQKAFEARGPRDRKGRSLRDFDLNTRLFKYPLSFLVYSEGFDFLPAPAKEYLYRRFDEVLTGRDTSEPFSGLSVSERRTILEILRATKPEFARTMAATSLASALSSPQRRP